MTTDPLGPVVITSRDIYDALVALRATVERLVSQAASHGDDIRDHEARLRAVEDVRPGPRIRDLEQQQRQMQARQWPLPAAGVLLSLAAVGIALLPYLTA